MTDVRIKRIVVRAGPEQGALARSLAERASELLARELLTSGHEYAAPEGPVRVEAVGGLAAEPMAEAIVRQVLRQLG